MTKTISFTALLGLFLAYGFAQSRESTPAVLAQASTTVKSSGAAPARGLKVITEEEAKAVALKAVPGRVQDIAIEKKLGANRYVVEVVPEKGGKEVDVVINMSTGKVLAIEN